LNEDKRIIAAKVAHYIKYQPQQTKKTGHNNYMASKGIASLALDTLIMQKVVTKTNRNYPFISWAWWFDPPKRNIQSVIQQFYEAGIQVKSDNRR
jgi:hypothetical protein